MYKAGKKESEKVRKMATAAADRSFINYNAVPSLQSIAEINIVINLWKLPDSVYLLKQHALHYDSDSIMTSGSTDRFHAMEKRLQEKLWALPLPNQLKREISNIIRPIGLQILMWSNGLFEPPYLHQKYRERIDYVCWTVEGIIDKIKTLNYNFGDDSQRIPVGHMFYTACYYCSDEYICSIWNTMTDDLRQYFITEMKYEKYEDHLLAYWVYFCNGELPKLMSTIKQYDHENIYDCNHSIYENMVSVSVFVCNVLAARYFWQKLTAEEINRNIISWVEHMIKCGEYDEQVYQRHNPYSDFLFFLLSQVNCKEQQRIFRKHSAEVLESLFFNWPWQKFLLPTIRVMFDYLGENVYVELLSTISQEIKQGRTVEKVFAEIWGASPMSLKHCFLEDIVHDTWHGRDIFWNLFTVNDLETVQLILDDASTEEKKHIVFAAVEDKEMFDLIESGKLHLLDVLLNATLSLDSDVKKFKDTLVHQYANDLYNSWICTNNWEMPDAFLSWCFNSEEQIESFKKQSINKIHIAHSLIGIGNWESLYKFMRWCFRSEEEIDQFKDMLYI